MLMEESEDTAVQIEQNFENLSRFDTIALLNAMPPEKLWKTLCSISVNINEWGNLINTEYRFRDIKYAPSRHEFTKSAIRMILAEIERIIQAALVKLQQRDPFVEAIRHEITKIDKLEK
jgi:hypothetical protein